MRSCVYAFAAEYLDLVPEVGEPYERFYPRYQKGLYAKLDEIFSYARAMDEP